MKVIRAICLCILLMAELPCARHALCQVEPPNAEQAAWMGTDRLSADSLDAFLRQYPKGEYADDADLYRCLLERIEEVRASKTEALLVIPFESLQPKWDSWKRRIPGKGVIGYSCVRHPLGVAIGCFAPGGLAGLSASYDESGVLVSPTGDGSVIAFLTEGMEYAYVNGITVRCSGHNIMYFAVIEGLGLVHLHGQGKVKLRKDDEPRGIGYERNAQTLLQLIKSQDQLDRSAAAQALGWVEASDANRAQVVTVLIAALEDQSGGVRRDAADALGRIGDARALDPLTKALGREMDRDARKAVEGSINTLKGGKAG